MISGARYQRVATYPVISSSVCLANPKSRICRTGRQSLIESECCSEGSVGSLSGLPSAHSPHLLPHYSALSPGEIVKQRRYKRTLIPIHIIDLENNKQHYSNTVLVKHNKSSMKFLEGYYSGKFKGVNYHLKPSKCHNNVGVVSQTKKQREGTYSVDQPR